MRSGAWLPIVVLTGLGQVIDGQTPAAPPAYAGLPNVTGYSQDQVKTIVGPPVVTRTKAGVTSWLYATPDGDRYVYFVNGAAMMAPPAAAKPRAGGAAPAVSPGCSQAPEARVVITIAASTPLYSAPRVRPEAVVRMAAGTSLTVLRTDGAWFAVSLGGTHGAYVHCSDVRVTQ